MILPFDMHSKTDISALRRSVMETLAASLYSSGAEVVGIEAVKERMLKEGVKRFDEKDAAALGKEALADFAVLGSITKLGQSAGADWRILDLKDGKGIAFYFKSSESEGELIKKIRDAAPVMRARMDSALLARPAVKSGIIDKIIVAGNRRVDTEAITRKLISKPGEPYSPDDVKEDIRTLFGTGFFDDISADLTDTASGKVLVFTVKEMPFVKKVDFKGNKEIKDEKIKEALTIKENTVLDRVILGENAEKIKAMYAEEGYYLASVTPVIESDGLEAKVVFNIDEGPAVKVKRITFIGNGFFEAEKLKGLMNTTEVGIFSVVSGSGKFNEFIFHNDLAIIMSKYFDNGFINADILDQRVLLSEDKKWFYITIALFEGEQFNVGDLDVKGEMLATKEELLEKLKLKTGEVFNRTRLSKGVDAVTDVYGDKGYAYADIKPVTQVNPEKRTIDITVDIKKNDLVYIERIDISGNVRTRDKVIRREMELGEGGLYASSEIKRSRNNLRRLGYFEDVRITQTQGSAPDKMKLDIEVKERPTGSVSLGFGYSSVDKLIGTASISQSNFMGTGIKLDLSGTVSSSSSKYVLGFTEPWLFDKPISAGFDIYNTDKDYPDFKLNKKGFDLRFGFPITKRYTRGYLTYKLEDVDITDVADTASTFIKDQAGKSTESSIKAVVRRDTRDDAFFPSEGSVVNLSTEFAGGPLGGTSHFIKYEGDAVKFFPLPWEATFSLHGALGYVQGYQGHTVPIYEKYFLGGINSVRGFQTRSISPKDPATGDLIGGNIMLVMNAEFLFPVFPEQNIKGLVFFDAGNAYDNRIDLSELRKGAGVGIRWFSPLGPLRLELGFNLDKKDGEDAQQWDFAIGTIF
ncbi:MAG: outer membrane protein assembly factor BamA [Deltaproteobacteria bacterium]|nr:outer membrane protein assembly factor BamA [Deltaproteobacteria bacterium]